MTDLCSPVKCPDCKQGKHGNCDGTAWCTTHDATAPCPCDDVSHSVDAGEQLAPPAETCAGVTPVAERAVQTGTLLPPVEHSGDPYDDRDGLYADTRLTVMQRPLTPPEEPYDDRPTEINFWSAPGANIDPKGKTAFELLRGMSYGVLGMQLPSAGKPDARLLAIIRLLHAIGAAYGGDDDTQQTEAAVQALHVLGVTQPELRDALAEFA